MTPCPEAFRATPADARPLTDPQWIVCCAVELNFIAPRLAVRDAFRLARGACGIARASVPEYTAAALALGLAATVLH